MSVAVIEVWFLLNEFSVVIPDIIHRDTFFSGSSEFGRRSKHKLGEKGSHV